MNPDKKISILICHCAAKEKLAELIRDAVREALNERMEVSVVVYRPPKHYKGEESRNKYWSEEDTFDYLIRTIQRDGISVLLASDPVIKIIQGSSEEIPIKSLGSDPIGCVHNLDKHLEEFFHGIGIIFNKVSFWKIILEALTENPSLDASGPYQWLSLYRSIYGDLSPQSCLCEKHFQENFLVVRIG